jgi:hypothetical protein
MRGDGDVRPWFRQKWPWLLMAAPAASIVGGVVMWSLAVATDDGLVATDYYKRGLAINRRLAHAPAPRVPLHATLRVADGLAVARIEEIDVPSARTVRLTLEQPAASSKRVILLARDASGAYVGTLETPITGRWIATLESDAWRLPTTTGLGPMTEVRFGTSQGAS